MKRREFLLATGCTILSGSAIGSSQRPAVGLEFQLSAVPDEKPTNIDSILVKFTSFKITPLYLDESSGLDITVELDIEGEPPITKSVSGLSFTNGRTIDRAKIQDKSEKDLSQVVIDELDKSGSNLQGDIYVRVNHPDISERTYNQSVEINQSNVLTNVIFHRNRNSRKNGDATNVNIGEGYSGRNIVVVATMTNVNSGEMSVNGNTMTKEYIASSGDSEQYLFTYQDDGSLGTSVDFSSTVHAYQVFTSPSFNIVDTVDVDSGTKALSGAPNSPAVQFYAHGGADDNGNEHPADSSDLSDWDSDSIFSVDTNSGEFCALAYNKPSDGSVDVPSNPTDGRYNGAMGVTVKFD